MRKGVAYLLRYRDVSLAANRYLAALAQVDNPTDAIRILDRVTPASNWLQNGLQIGARRFWRVLPKLRR